MKDVPLLRSLLTLASIIEARDPYTGGHIWRVSKYARALADRAGLAGDEAFRVELGGLVHDIGKVGVSDAILCKQGKLTAEEYAAIKKHPEIGRNLMAGHPLAPYVMDAVYHHHERADGRGYPDGLASGGLAPMAGIITVADAFDAMTSVRPYRKGLLPEQAYAVIDAERGRQFDADLAGRFTELGRRGGLDHIIKHCGEERLMLCCPECGPVIAPPAGAKAGDCLPCPSCSEEFLLHPGGDSYELEARGKSGRPRNPEPDTAAIDAFLDGVGG